MRTSRALAAGSMRRTRAQLALEFLYHDYVPKRQGFY